MTDVTSQTLRRWREAQGWDVPRMARELRKAARDTGEEMAAHHGLVKMILRWERGNRAPRERYRLLYLKVFADIADGLSLSPGMTAGTEFALRVAAISARAASLPGPDQIKALEAAALAKPTRTMTPAEILTPAAESIASLHEVAGKLADLSALLGDEAGEGPFMAGRASRCGRVGQARRLRSRLGRPPAQLRRIDLRAGQRPEPEPGCGGLAGAVLVLCRRQLRLRGCRSRCRRHCARTGRYG